jgi:hypothetical protein
MERQKQKDLAYQIAEKKRKREWYLRTKEKRSVSKSTTK